MRDRQRRAGVASVRDRGAATILVLAIGLTLVAAGVFGASVGAARVGRHQARVAADLGALAGGAKAIFGADIACARAARFVTANRGRMTSCVVDGLEIVVRAEVEVRVVLGLTRTAVATARAGPVHAIGLRGGYSVVYGGGETSPRHTRVGRRGFLSHPAVTLIVKVSVRVG